MNPPSQSSTEALHTVTLYIYIYRRQIDPPSIEHRCLAYQYTKSVSFLDVIQDIDIGGR